MSTATRRTSEYDVFGLTAAPIVYFTHTGGFAVAVYGTNSPGYAVYRTVGGTTTRIGTVTGATGSVAITTRLMGAEYYAFPLSPDRVTVYENRSNIIADFLADAVTGRDLITNGASAFRAKVIGRDGDGLQDEPNVGADESDLRAYETFGYSQIDVLKIGLPVDVMTVGLGSNALESEDLGFTDLGVLKYNLPDEFGASGAGDSTYARITTPPTGEGVYL